MGTFSTQFRLFSTKSPLLTHFSTFARDTLCWFR
jgi:hypothetical protein